MCLGGRCCAPSQDSLCLLLSSPISLTKHQKLFPTVHTQMSQAHSQWATLNPPSSPSISSIWSLLTSFFFKMFFRRQTPHPSSPAQTLLGPCPHSVTFLC